jgi:hypothetical protein
MSDDSPLNLDAPRTLGAGKQGRKLTFKERMLHNFREFVAMFLYLWLLFGLFSYHEAIVLAKHHIDYKPFGLAFINAFVLAKIMLVAEELRVGTRFRKSAPIFPILHKSLLFAVIFICFNMAEEIVIGLFKGETVTESIPKIGGGSLLGLVIASLIITVALIPFFAFRELSRVMGKGVLETLFLKGQANERASGIDGHAKQANRFTSASDTVEDFQKGSPHKS